jgi:hypothetical protein
MVRAKSTAPIIFFFSAVFCRRLRKRLLETDFIGPPNRRGGLVPREEPSRTFHLLFRPISDIKDSLATAKRNHFNSLA